jgi:F-type H+-transporting ATPase subunit a
VAGDNPLSHVVQHPLVETPADLGFLTPNGVVTLLSDQITALLAGALLLTLFLPLFVRRRAGSDAIGRLVPSGWANLLESVCEYLRKNAFGPVLGPHTDRFIKYLWSLFFFLLTLNLIGLLPIPALSGLFGLHLGGTATGNIWFTATMAIVTLLLVVVNGLRFGGVHWIKHFCPGPLWLAPVLIPVEIIGLFAKAFSLAVRLFANMLAGHVLMGVLLGFILQIGTKMGAAIGFGMAIPLVAMSVAVSMLELFVAFLQAYIFSFLTALFIGMAVNVHGDEGHEHAEATAHH